MSHCSYDRFIELRIAVSKLCLGRNKAATLASLAIFGAGSATASGMYLAVNGPRMKESLQLKRDRYFGAPSVKEAIAQRENLEKRLDEAIGNFGWRLKRDCLEEMKANSVLDYLEEHYGRIDLDAIKEKERRAEQKSVEARYDVSPEIARSLCNLMNTADCSTPEGLLMMGARLGEKKADALAEEHKHREWVALYGQGLTKDEIELAKTSWNYKRKVQHLKRAASSG